MSDDSKPQIKVLFRDASQQRDIAIGFNEREFQEEGAIRYQHKELLIQEEKDYRADYTKRVAKVVKDLQRKDGARDRRLGPLGGDKASPSSQIKSLFNEEADRRDGFAARRQARSDNQGQAQQRNIERDRPPGPAR